MDFTLQKQTTAKKVYTITQLSNMLAGSLNLLYPVLLLFLFTNTQGKISNLKLLLFVCVYILF